MKKFINWFYGVFKKSEPEVFMQYYPQVKSFAHCFKCGKKGKRSMLFWGTQKGYICKKCDTYWTAVNN